MIIISGISKARAPCGSCLWSVKAWSARSRYRVVHASEVMHDDARDAACVVCPSDLTACPYGWRVAASPEARALAWAVKRSCRLEQTTSQSVKIEGSAIV